MRVLGRDLDWAQIFTYNERGIRVTFSECVVKVFSSFDGVDFTFQMDFSKSQVFLHSDEWIQWALEEFRKAKESVYLFQKNEQIDTNKFDQATEVHIRLSI